MEAGVHRTHRRPSTRTAAVAVLAPLAATACIGLLRPGPDVVATADAVPVTFGLGAVRADLRLPREVRPPASVTLPGLVRVPAPVDAGRGVSLDPAPVAATVGPIPARALAAYQRAGTIIGAADPACHLSWTVIAAIGEVESDHGRYGGAVMAEDGTVHPDILGPPLTGRRATQRIRDTDSGRLDGDVVVDRAVGPLQFLPSTWTVVGVDADDDGRRDPQDIDDASLAAAVYLCSGQRDLATTAGLRRAVYRYNHSPAYVDLVLGLAAGYARADAAVWTTVPTAAPPTGTTVIEPSSSASPTADPTATPTSTGTPPWPTASPTGKPTATATEAPPPTSATTPKVLTTAPPVTPPDPEPTTPTAGPTSGEPEPTTSPAPSATPSPTPCPSDDPTEGATPTEEPETDTGCDPTGTSEEPATPAGPSGSAEPPEPDPAPAPPSALDTPPSTPPPDEGG